MGLLGDLPDGIRMQDSRGKGGNARVITVSGGDFSQLSESQKDKLRMLGMDPDALAAQAGPDPERLERLAKLHEQGALSDAEFESQKKRILEG